MSITKWNFFREAHVEVQLAVGTEEDWLALDKTVVAKIRHAQGILRELGKVVVAFSAGVDSTFLLALAVRVLGRENVVAAMGVSPSLAQRELGHGRRIARQMGLEVVEIQTGELDNPSYAANPANRCFFCKKDLFIRLKALADAAKAGGVVSGANADDAGDFRPGLLAGRELGVRNPLMEAALAKQEIRTASRAMGLPTWDKPAMACLASRVPYGQQITAERLGRIELAENALKDIGFSQVRVRDHQTLARIEVPTADLDKILRNGQEIVRRFREIGYHYVALDLQGFRSGSMNEVLPAETRTI